MKKLKYRFVIYFALTIGAILLGAWYAFVPHQPSGVEEVVVIAADASADACPVTEPPDPLFMAPPPYSPQAPWPGFAWYGDETLWTVVRTDGVWSSLPSDEHGSFQKVVWWREGYSWQEEPKPALTVTGRRLDGDSPPLESLPATNAYAEDMGSAMMTGVLLPTLGCWEITGRYGTAELSFVVWVEE